MSRGGRKPATVKMLDAAMAYINSQGYDVSLRRVCYHLIGIGILDSKADYRKLKDATAKARKEYYDGWEPDTLTDSTRHISKSSSPMGKVEILNAIPYWSTFVPNLYEDAEEIPFILFESEGSEPQFEFLAPWCDRAAFKGDCSIPHKYNIAIRCDELSDRYDGKPVHILYFGDYDSKGMEIPENAMRDIGEWAGCELNYTRVGINADHPDLFNLAGKGDGTFEWESMDTEDAREILHAAMDEFMNVDDIEAKIETAEADSDAFSEEIIEALAELLEKAEAA